MFTILNKWLKFKLKETIPNAVIHQLMLFLGYIAISFNNSYFMNLQKQFSARLIVQYILWNQ